MQIMKQFATDSTSLDEHLDQLIEVLAELLEDYLGPALSASHQRAEVTAGELRPSGDRVTHVVVNPPKVTDLLICQ
jgi:hypothetical protein